MRILDFVFSLYAFLSDSVYECICQLDYEYHALCLLSLIFKESLYLLSITQVSSLRGEHKTHASVNHHMFSCHSASILRTGSKRLLSRYPSISPHVKHTWIENERFAD